MNCSVGIDVGLDGAVVAIINDATHKWVADSEYTYRISTKNGKKDYLTTAMRDILRNIEDLSMETSGNLIIVLEKQTAMPGQGVTSMFRLGKGFGIWEGLLTGMRLPYKVVSAREWQSTICKGYAGDTKTRSIAAASNLLPELSLMRTNGCKTPHSGIADAACMALYARGL